MATYRFEMSATNRALCQNSECKKNGVKIQKGEFRMGTLVMFEEHTTWKWKHWGCVTPLQIKNLQDQVGPLDDLDLDSDLPAIIDGYDEITPESQDKIKYALQNGHVHDEDWKGLPEKNRPGQKGINKRTPKKKDADDEDRGSNAGDAATPSKPKAKKSRSKKTKVESDQESEAAPTSPPAKKARGRKRKVEESEDDLPAEPPKKKAAGRKRKAVMSDSEDEVMPKATTSRGRKAKTETRVKAEVESDREEATTVAKPKKSRAKKVKAEPETIVKPEADVDEEDTVVAAPKAKRARASKKNAKTEPSVDEEGQAPPAAKPKRSRGKQVKPEPEVKADPEDELALSDIEAVATLKPEAEDEMEMDAAPFRDESTEEGRDEKPAAPKKKAAKGKGKSKAKATSKAK